MVFWFSIFSLSFPFAWIAGFYHGFKIAKDIYTTGDISEKNLPFKGFSELPDATVELTKGQKESSNEQI